MVQATCSSVTPAIWQVLRVERRICDPGYIAGKSGFDLDRQLKRRYHKVLQGQDNIENPSGSLNRILVVGAGLSGSVMARMLADTEYKCLVIDERSHVAGECHISVDEASGVMVHRYGPHILHGRCRIWTFVRRFGDWVPYRHAVFASVKGGIFSLPVNLLTINQFFCTQMTPLEARAFVGALTHPSAQPANFHEQALSMGGGRTV